MSSRHDLCYRTPFAYSSTISPPHWNRPWGLDTKLDVFQYHSNYCLVLLTHVQSRPPLWLNLPLAKYWLWATPPNAALSSLKVPTRLRTGSTYSIDCQGMSKCSNHSGLTFHLCYPYMPVHNLCTIEINKKITVKKIFIMTALTSRPVLSVVTIGDMSYGILLEFIKIHGFHPLFTLLIIFDRCEN